MSTFPWRLGWVAVVAVLGSAGLSACRSHAGFSEQYAKTLRPAILQGDWSAAAETIADSKGDVYKEEDRVMFWLNHGTALHYAGQYEASSRVFFRAEETIQSLFTKSISEDIGRFVATETVQTYAGEDYERTLSYLYTALNAAQRGRWQDALVEVRRADQFLQKMKVHFQKEGGLGTVYTQDAFMLWLIGLFLEIEGTYADAYIAYQEARNAYLKLYQPNFGTNPPPFLGEDLARTAYLLGREEEAEDWAKHTRTSGHTFQLLQGGHAEIILIHGTGESPQKREKSFQAVLPDGYALRLAIPEIAPRGSRIGGSVLAVADSRSSSALAEPVQKISVANFRAREGELRARAVARAAIKYAASKATSEAVRGDRKDRGRDILGSVLNVVGGLAATLSEQADLRSWTLLPAEFRVARLWVPAGVHTARVDLVDAAGRPRGVAATKKFEVKAGDRVFWSVRSVQ